jgi:hypothetical protein
MSTRTDRRIVVVTPQGEYLTHMRTDEHGALPLTNPGHFAAGVYRGVIHTAEGTATIEEEAQ